LDKSVGKKCLVDGSPETCWTSQQGLPQFIHITFGSPVYPEVISITFQGGFVGKRCSILADLPSNKEDSEPAERSAPLIYLCSIFPEDVNRKQAFELAHCSSPVNQLRIVFEESSDFFGRITVYDLQVEGRDGTQ